MIVERSFLNYFPNTITILPTYRCNAACEQCCFESNPSVKGRLSLDEILSVIDRAKAAFPALQLVAFSGGECTLLKSDLYAAVRRVTEHGLMSRIVTNGGWGKTVKHASEVAEALRMNGLVEASISTGLDHQKWVPLQSVVNAAEALVSRGVRTIITIESDSADSHCIKECTTHETIATLLRNNENPLMLMSNVWMPFNTEHVERTGEPPKEGGCEQLFHNMVFTPHREISACCGLTYEHIPELKIGRIDIEASFADMFSAQLDDFLKVWIHIEGPKKIASDLLGNEGEALLAKSVHICQSCVLIHKNEKIRAALKERYAEHVPRVMSRFMSKLLLHKIELKQATNKTSEEAFA